MHRRTCTVYVALAASLSLVLSAHASADQTTIGVTVNGTVGHHVESDRAESVPFLPLPAFELEHVHRQFRVHLEAVPPIGPVPLNQSNSWSESLAPRVSYLNGEVLYASPIVPIEVGIGETVLTQQTLDRVPWEPIAALHYSRVAGARFALRAHLWQHTPAALDASLAVNPSMHGLEDGLYSEYASLVDGSIRWMRNRGRYDIVYGLRYLNYTAAYSATNRLGDRNHLLMPFVGIDWHRQIDRSTPAFAVQSGRSSDLSRRGASIGITLLGTNGNRTYTQANSDSPLNFQLVPQIDASYTTRPYEIDGHAILPTAASDPFGSPSRWSYVSFDVLREVAKNGLALGIGETFTTLEPAKPIPNVQTHTRSEAVDLVARMPIARTAGEMTYLQVRVDPYVHVSSYFAYSGPNNPSSSQSTAHGSRVDAEIVRCVGLGRASLRYGLRYVNQTTNYTYTRGFTLLTRSTSLMPLAGLSIPLGGGISER